MTYIKGAKERNYNDFVYIKGDDVTENSLRLRQHDEDGEFAHVERLTNGLWYNDSLSLGANTLWLGKEVGIGAIGHNLIVKQSDDPNEVHFFPHTTFDTSTKTHGHDTAVTHITGSDTRIIFQSDFSSQWVSTSYTWNATSIAAVIVSDTYLKTGTTAATAPVRFRVWQGADANGVLVFDQWYPASDFPASTEIKLQYNGAVEYHAATQYFLAIESAANLSFLANAAIDELWTAADVMYKTEDKLLQTLPYVDGATYALDQYLIDSRKIYVCNVTGVQTGTFASNAAKWNELQHGSGGNFWKRADTYDIELASENDRVLLTNVIAPEGRNLDLSVVSAGYGVNVNAKAYFHEQVLVNTGKNVWFGAADSSATALHPFQVSQGGESRLAVTSSSVYFKSPDGTKVWDLNNDGIDTTAGVLNTPTSFAINDGTNRLLLNAQNTLLYSPNGNSYWDISNTLFNYGDGTRNRFTIDGTNVKLISTDGANVFTVANASMILHDGTRNRVFSSVVSTELISANGLHLVRADSDEVELVASTSYVSVKAGTFDFYDGTKNRLKVNGSASWMTSPDDNFKFGVSNNTANVTVGAQFRFDVTDVHTNLLSPDGAVIVDVNNSKVEVTGDTNIVGDTIISKSLTVGTAGDAGATPTPIYTYLYLNRWAGDHASTGLIFQGGGDGVGGYHSDFVVDNFWGNLRTYVNATSARAFIFQNIGTGNCELQVQGGVLVQGHDGFNAIAETAQLTVGDGDNYIRATYADLLLIHGYSGIKFSDLTTMDYLTLFEGTIRMTNLPTTDPQAIYELWNDNGTLKISAG